MICTLKLVLLKQLIDLTAEIIPRRYSVYHELIANPE